jgi:hypothetical protein
MAHKFTSNLLKGLAVFLTTSASLLAQTTTPSATPLKPLKRVDVNWTNDNMLKTGGVALSQYDTLSKYEYNASGNRVAAIDYDTTYQEFYVMKKPSLQRLKLTNGLGVGFPYCGSFSGTDRTMFLGPGFFNNLNIDYFWGNKLNLGLGLLAGYSAFGVDMNAYAADMRRLASLRGINQIGFLPTKSFEHMYLLLGPVLSVPLGKKFTFDFGAKAGLFRNDPAVLGTTIGPYDPRNSIMFQAVTPTGNRNNFGYNFSLALLYALTDRWSVGLTSNVFNTTTEYAVVNNNTWQPVDNLWQNFSRKQGSYNFGLAVAYQIPFDNKKIIPVQYAPPTCCVPQPEDNLNGQVYEFTGETFDQPGTFPAAIKWKGGCNAGNESYTMRLYKTEADSKTAKLLKEIVNSSDKQLLLTANDLQWNTPGNYYYTLHSTQKTNKGVCMSEVATVTFNHVKPRIETKEIVKTEVCNTMFQHTVSGGKIAPRYKRSIVDTTLICTQCVAQGDKEQAKEFMRYEYETERISIPAGLKTYIEGFSNTQTYGDANVMAPVLEMEKGWKNKYRNLSFTYTIQPVCTKADGSSSASGSATIYTIYLNGKGEITKIEQAK